MLIPERQEASEVSPMVAPHPPLRVSKTQCRRGTQRTLMASEFEETELRVWGAQGHHSSSGGAAQNPGGLQRVLLDSQQDAASACWETT